MVRVFFLSVVCVSMIGKSFSAASGEEDAEVRGLKQQLLKVELRTKIKKAVVAGQEGDLSLEEQREKVSYEEQARRSQLESHKRGAELDERYAEQERRLALARTQAETAAFAQESQTRVQNQQLDNERKILEIDQAQRERRGLLGGLFGGHSKEEMQERQPLSGRDGTSSGSGGGKEGSEEGAPSDDETCPIVPVVVKTAWSSFARNLGSLTGGMMKFLDG